MIVNFMNSVGYCLLAETSKFHLTNDYCTRFILQTSMYFMYAILESISVLHLLTK